MRLNLGCGADIKADYTNVDFRSIHPTVQQVDLSVFPWPWEDESCDEVMMLDFLEHFEFSKTRIILKECRRVLRKGGVLVVQVPDLEVCCMAVLGHGGVPCHVCGACMSGVEDGYEGCSSCGTDWSDISEAAVKRMYGGQDYIGNYHMTGFTRQTLESYLGTYAFVGIQFVEREHQFANWSLKATARRF